MLFNNIKKYLVVFSTILLIGGNIGFSSEVNLQQISNIDKIIMQLNHNQVMSKETNNKLFKQFGQIKFNNINCNKYNNICEPLLMMSELNEEQYNCSTTLYEAIIIRFVEKRLQEIDISNDQSDNNNLCSYYFCNKSSNNDEIQLVEFDKTQSNEICNILCNLLIMFGEKYEFKVKEQGNTLIICAKENNNNDEQLLSFNSNDTVHVMDTVNKWNNNSNFNKKYKLELNGKKLQIKDKTNNNSTYQESSTNTSIIYNNEINKGNNFTINAKEKSNNNIIQKANNFTISRQTRAIDSKSSVSDLNKRIEKEKIDKEKIEKEKNDLIKFYKKQINDLKNQYKLQMNLRIRKLEHNFYNKLQKIKEKYEEKNKKK